MSKDRFAPLKETVNKGVEGIEHAASAVGAAALKLEQSVVGGLFSPGAPAMPTSSAQSHTSDKDEDNQDSETDSPAASLEGADANWNAYYREHPDQAPAADEASVNDNGATSAGKNQGSPAASTSRHHQINLSALPLGKAGAASALDAYVGSNPMARQNTKAFLDMIAVSEGTIGLGNNGYNAKVGGGIRSGNEFQGDIVNLGHGLRSSAYGRYQVMGYTYNGKNGHPGLKQKLAGLGFTDFSPAAQDAAALELLKERGALEDVKAGRFQEAVMKSNKEWASLPGAGYGQHENKLALLESAYIRSGGHVAGDVNIELAAAAPKHVNHGALKTTTLASAAPAPGKGRSAIIHALGVDA